MPLPPWWIAGQSQSWLLILTCFEDHLRSHECLNDDSYSAAAAAAALSGSDGFTAPFPSEQYEQQPKDVERSSEHDRRVTKNFCSALPTLI